MIATSSDFPGDYRLVYEASLPWRMLAVAVARPIGCFAIVFVLGVFATLRENGPSADGGSKLTDPAQWPAKAARCQEVIL